MGDRGDSDGSSESESESESTLNDDDRGSDERQRRSTAGELDGSGGSRKDSF